MPVRTAFRRFATTACLILLAGGCYWSVLLAWADHLYRVSTVESVREALRRVPGNAEYHARLAALAEAAGVRDQEVEAELRSAVAANPRMAETWISLALRAETHGDLAGAEAYLSRALHVDRMYATEWTAANFYFRNRQSEKFWPAARAALGVGDVRAYDPAPLFQLCWKTSRDAHVVLNRAIPDVGAVEARYLEFLVHENLSSVAEPVTQRVVAFAGDGDLGAVFEYCDRLITAGEAVGAVHAWNALCWRSLHRFRPLQPAERASLTNGDFSADPVQHGFDWRMPAAAGVTAERGGLPPRLWITLDGRQPEICELVEQYLALAPTRKYRLQFRYQTDGIEAGSGVRWRVEDLRGEELPSTSEDLASEQESGGVVRFSNGAGVFLAKLVLEYRRRPGATRIEGRVSIGGLSLEFDR